MIKQFLNSLLGQFIIGGLTVAGIAYFSNNINNSAISGLIAGVPIGLPSTIFVDDKRVSSYISSLLVTTGILFAVTAICWYLVHYEKFDKFKAVKYSMSIWLSLGLLFVFIKSFLNYN
jgi:hypothetical protein